MQEITYKGFTYKVEVEHEPEEASRRYHYAIDPAGKILTLDYTQYQSMSESSFQTLVELNFIERQNPIAAWNDNSLSRYKESLCQ